MSDPLLSLKSLPAPDLDEESQDRAHARLRAAREKPRRRRWLRAPAGRRLVLLTPVALIASGATAMALGVGVPNLDPDDPNSGVGCFETVGPDASGAILKPDPAQPDPISACRTEWREISRTNPQIPQRRFPELTGCVNANGAMYVFPTSSVRECIAAAEAMGGEQAFPLPQDPKDSQDPLDEEY